jgi:hypothetical protein
MALSGERPWAAAGWCRRQALTPWWGQLPGCSLPLLG